MRTVSTPPRSQFPPLLARRRTCSNLIHREPFHPLPPRERGMSKAPPPVHPTWAGVVKGQPPPAASPGPSPPAGRLLQLYKDCVARRTWARLCFETTGGEEELSFLCRVGGAATSTATKGSSKKQGRPANKRRRERARRRREAWVERRRGPAVEGAAAAWSSNHRSSSCQQGQQPSTGEAAVSRSSSPR